MKIYTREKNRMKCNANAGYDGKNKPSLCCSKADATRGQMGFINAS